MKKLFSVFLFAMLIAGVAHAGEVNYYNKSWAEIKAKAAAEHKYIFIDCYTDWCGWCKVMDKETMTDAGIISLLNDKFISVKMDMEKGEGIKMCMKYHVNGFPTFMFFNADGDYVYQSSGYQKTPEFLKELNNALDNNKHMQVPGYSQTLDVAFPEFYKKIFAGNGKREFPKEEEVVAFLDQQKDLLNEVSWAVISSCKLNEKYNNFFLENITKYKMLFGATGVNNVLSTKLNGKLNVAIKHNSIAELNDVLKSVDKYITEEPAATKNYFSVSFYKETKNWEKLTEAMDDYAISKGYDNTAYFNSIGWAMYEQCTDKKALAKACGWMKAVVEKEPQYAYEDTYASLLYKAGDLKEAKLWAAKAIETGKKAGEKTEATEELLKKMIGGK